MTDELTQVVQWLGLRMRVPEEWEIVRHSLAFDKGTLVFVDRRRETLRLHWRDCQRAPDLNRMLGDQRGKEALEFSGSKFRELNGHPGWQGFIREQNVDVRITHAAHFDVRTMRLIEVIATETCDEATAKSHFARLLSNVDVVSRADEARSFCAFGLDVTVPPGFRLTKASVKPADIVFEFAESSGDRAHPTGTRATVRRMGMAAAFAPADKQQLLQRESPDVSFRSIRTVSKPGHAAWSARGKQTHPRLMHLLGLGRHCDALLWHCESKNAIYSIATNHTKRKPLGAGSFSTTCCAEGFYD